jgi:hypothetical protein
MRASLLLSVFVLAATAAGPSFAQSGSGYSIMQDDFSIMVPEKGSRPSKPEPWLAPKYRSPRGTVEKVVIPRPKTVRTPRAATPPPLYVPETGRTLPNLPTISGAGPGGVETFQDRAARCAHQAGVYGSTATGNRNAYVGSCVNQ